MAQITDPDRCFAVVGTAFSGPHYCGNPAKLLNEAGRPVCGVHARHRQHAERWDENASYPFGPLGKWKFDKGAAR